MDMAHVEGGAKSYPTLSSYKAHGDATTTIMSPIVRVGRRSRSCRGMVSDHGMGHMPIRLWGHMNIVHHEGVSLLLPNLELIQGTRGCLDYHHEPYR